MQLFQALNNVKFLWITGLAIKQENAIYSQNNQSIEIDSEKQWWVSSKAAKEAVMNIANPFKDLKENINKVKRARIFRRPSDMHPPALGSILSAGPGKLPCLWSWGPAAPAQSHSEPERCDPRTRCGALSNREAHPKPSRGGKNTQIRLSIRNSICGVLSARASTIPMLTPNLRCDAIRKWGLLGWWGSTLPNRIHATLKRDLRELSHPSHQ
jgi:hypothetical protein